MDPGKFAIHGAFPTFEALNISLFNFFFMNIYVANIPWKATEEQLRTLFAGYGDVSSAKIIMDKVTQRSRGFGFVEMPDDNAGRQAITALNGQDFLGKNLVVNEARPREERPGGFRSGGGGGFRRSSFNRED